MRIVVGPDQLHVDVHAIASLLDTAFEYMAHAQLARYLRQIFRRTAVARSGSTRDYAKPADPRQRGDDFVLNTLCKKRVVFFRTEILERQHCYAFLLRKRSRCLLPGIQPYAPSGGSEQNEGSRECQIHCSKSPWRAARRDFSSSLQLRLSHHFWQFRIPNAVPVEIHEEDRNAVLDGAFPQVMQKRTPLSRVAQIFRVPLGQQNVPVVSAIHHPLPHVNPSSGDVRCIIHVANFVDRSAMDAHSQLQLRVVFQLLADLDRTPHGRFWTVKKNERHPIAHGKPDQAPCFFGTADLLCATDDLSQLFLVLTLLIEEQGRITD